MLVKALKVTAFNLEIEMYSEPCQTCTIATFAKLETGFRKLHLRCFTRFCIGL